MSTQIGPIDRAAQEHAERLLRASVFADLRGLGWAPIETLLEAPPISIPEPCRNVVVPNPRQMLKSFIQNEDFKIIEEVPEAPQSFADFTRDVIEPYMIKEISRRFFAARTQLKFWNEKQQAVWQNEIVKQANSWMGQQ